MNRNKKRLLTIFDIAVRNLELRKIRTGFMIFFVCVLALSLFVISVIVNSMEQRFNNTIDRMGADIIIVPSSAAADVVNSIFLGESFSLYFDKKMSASITSVSGVAKITPQLYIATLDAVCCSQPTQIVAFDPKTDFTVRPWLDKLQVTNLEKDQVLIGASILANAGDKIKFFTHTFEVIGVLEKTDTGFDNRVYMDFQDAYELMRTPELQNIISDQIKNEKAAISSLMVKIDDNADARIVAAYINHALRKLPIKAYTRNGMFDKFSDSMKTMVYYSNFLIVLTFILVVLAMACIFTITINERKHEFGILTAVGATSFQITAIILTEAALIGITGGFFGIVAAGIILIIFQNTIFLLFGIPSITASVYFLNVTALMCIGVSLFVCIFSSLYSTLQISRQEPLLLIRGEE